MGKALTDPLLSHVEVGEERVASSVQAAKAGFQVPLPRSHLVLVREANQNRHKPLLLIEDHHAFFVKARRNAHRL
jgi:hypothetical protein